MSNGLSEKDLARVRERREITEKLVEELGDREARTDWRYMPKEYTDKQAFDLILVDDEIGFAKMDAADAERLKSKKALRYNLVIALAWFVIFGGVVLGITAIQALVGKHIGYPNEPAKWSHGNGSR